MKYIAVFDDEFLSNFRLDDNGLTLVMGDKRGYNRAVRLKPLIQNVLTAEHGESIYLTQDHIDCLLTFEREQMIKEMYADMMRSLDDLKGEEEKGGAE